MTHAAIQFANDFPEEQRKWFETSNTVAILATSSLEELELLSTKLTEVGVRHSRFVEPDIGNQLTSIAIVPGPEVKKLCAKYKLAGKQSSI